MKQPEVLVYTIWDCLIVLRIQRESAGRLMQYRGVLVFKYWVHIKHMWAFENLLNVLLKLPPALRKVCGHSVYTPFLMR